MPVGVWVCHTFVPDLPSTYDPSTYNYHQPVPGTPDPEPYNREAYEAWGQEHFGDEWLDLRQTMLRERDPYLWDDSVYKQRQRELRIMEHKAERRPFQPVVRNVRTGKRSARFCEGTLDDEAWKQLWERLKRELSPEDLVSHQDPPTTPNSPHRSPPPQGSRSPRSAPSTPSLLTPPPPTPPRPSEDKWEALEWDRKHEHLSAEEYNFARIFLREEEIDDARNANEDLEGDRIRSAEIAEICSFARHSYDYHRSQDVDAMRSQIEYERRMRRFNRRARGKTLEQIDAEDREAEAAGLSPLPSQTPLALVLEQSLANRTFLPPEIPGSDGAAPPPFIARLPLARARPPTPAPAGRIAVGQDARGRTIYRHPDGRLRDSRGRFVKKAGSAGARRKETMDKKTKQPPKPAPVRPKPPPRTTPRRRMVYQKERSSRRLDNLPPELGALEREPAMTRRRRTPRGAAGQPAAAPAAAQRVSDDEPDVIYDDGTLEPVNAVVERWLGQLEPHDDDDIGTYQDGDEAVEGEQDDHQ